MFKILLLSLLSTLILSASELEEKALKDIKIEVDSLLYKQQQEYMHDISFELQIVEQNTNKREDKLKKIYEILKRDRQIIIAQYLFDRILRLSDFRKLEVTHEYLLLISDILIPQRVCDGYLAKAQYLLYYKKDEKKYQDILELGIDNCSVDWKKEMLIERLR